MDNYSRLLNQMNGLFRNSFLRRAALGLAIILLAGCGRPSVPPPSPTPTAENRAPKALLPLMGHTIQVGAFSQVENAARLTKRLLAQGLPAFYYRAEIGLYRVRFGNYPSYGAALASAKQQQAKGVIELFTVIRPQTYPAVRYRGQEPLIRERLVAIARQFIGVPYRWGGANAGAGFDCSGLGMMVYQLIGFDLPRRTRDQFRKGRAIGREQLRPGDLIFFSTDWSGQVSHVGIYQGEGLFIHAPASGRAVSRANLATDYFRKHFLGARTYL